MHPIFLCMLAGALFGTGLSIATEPVPETAQAQPAPYIRSAHPMPPTLAQAFSTADRDGDGLLSRLEAQQARLLRLLENFDLLDNDGDGVLSVAELRPLLRPRVHS